MSGFITIERKLWDHPLFKPEPMTEREAWMWMIAQAAWSGTRHRVGNELVEVPRGSFMATLREMQSVFMWKSDKRVRTFLKMLEAEGMIGRTTVGSRNAPKTHVTICKYEEYQTRGRTKDAPETHHGRTKDAVKKQDNNKQEEEPYGSLSEPSPANDLSHAVSRYNAAASAAGWPQVQKLTPQRSKQLRARLRDCDGLDGWEEALRRAFDSDFLCGRTSKAWTGFGFDWMTKQTNFTKLTEGNYDNRTGNTGNSERPQNRPDPALEQIARLTGLGTASGNGRG